MPIKPIMKTANTYFVNRITFALIYAAIIFSFSSCKSYLEDTTFRTSDDKMIDEYIEEVDTSMLDFLNIADKVGYRGLIHAYGTNTCFIPTNSAIKAYSKQLGLESLMDMTNDELEKFMDYHIVRDTIPSSQFIDGRLSKPTMLGKYLITKTVQEGSQVPVIKVNRNATIIKKDIRVSNGIIHKIDSVLIPNSNTVGEMILKLPDNYSLFKSIMLETHLVDTLTLNSNSGSWYTVLLQSDEAFQTAGITNKESLIAQMKIAQPDYAANETKLLDMYARYHVVNRLAYVADLSITSSELTLANNQVITLKTSKDSLIVNEFRSSSKFEKGISVNKESDWTDYSCKNGVLIDLDGYIQPVKRGAEAVYWEITDQPEIKKLKEYRKIGSSVVFKPGELSELNFGGKNSPTLTYTVEGAFAEKLQYIHGDYFTLKLRPAVVQWMEIKTPLLTEGVYNVWICWRRGGTSNKFKTTFKQEGKEDQLLSNVFDLSVGFNTTNSPEVNLSSGSKQYNAKIIHAAFCSSNCGAIKVDYTGRHILRLDALVGDVDTYWDMIQFIPVDQDQLWPRFDYMGNAIYQCTPDNQIYPQEQTGAFYNSDPCK